jgi:hypothetical protein
VLLVFNPQTTLNIKLLVPSHISCLSRNSKEWALSWVVDRAIFGQEVFREGAWRYVTLPGAELASRKRSERLDGDREDA